MFELSSFIGWLSTVAAGILLSIIQKLAQRYPPLGAVNQKVLAITLAVMAGLVAYVAEFILGIDLFSDVNSILDIIRLVATVLAFGQATYALVLRR